MIGIWLAIAGLSGAGAVSAEAAARHLLAGEGYRLDLVATATRHGLIHAVALVGVTALAVLWEREDAGRFARLWLAIAGWSFAVGLVLFPGGFYLLAAGVTPLIGRLVPLGGLALIAGWIALLFAALAPRPAK